MMLNIDETKPKYELEKLKPDSESHAELYTKHLLEYQDRSQFWKHALEVGAKCMRFARRNVFTPEQRRAYRAQGKIPVEPQEMKTVINVLVDQIQKGVRSTIITYDDDSPPENAARPEVINSVSGHFKQRLKIERLRRSVLWDALITGFPSWLWFDKEYDIAQLKDHVVMYHPKWDSMLPSRWFSNTDGSDINDVMKLSFVSKSQLKDWYPERYETYKSYDPTKAWSNELVSSVCQENTGTTMYDRASVVMNSITGGTFDSHHDQIMLIERFFETRYKRNIYIRESDGDIVEIPQDWEMERVERWKIEHPDYDIGHHECKTLWVTTIASDGFIWENNMHWFQEDARLPGKAYVPDMVDRIPVSIGNDMLPYVLSIAASETEGLHQVRTGTGTTTFAGEGSFKHPDRVKTELNKQDGVILLTKKAAAGGARNAVFTDKRTPNTTFIEFSERTRGKMAEATGINEALRGIMNPRQSNKAKLTDINQGLASQQSYIMNYNDFNLDLENLILKMIPYQYTEETIVQINDDYGMQNQTIQVNQQGFDYSGQAYIVANDLTISRYLAIPILSDDSQSNKEREQAEFMEFIAAVGNTLYKLNPQILVHILNGLENRFAKQAAVQISQVAQQIEQQNQQLSQAEQQHEDKIEKGRRDVDWAKMNKTSKNVNVKIDPESAEQHPMGTAAIVQAINNQ